MNDSIAIQVENLSKAYQLGQIGTGTISRDLERFIVTKVLRKEDPFLKIGQTNDRTVKGESDIVWSLKDISFEINKGDAVGIVGKNGAGKSTLLKLLSRVTSPTTGSIKVKGRIASLLEVGTGFHPELSGRENIYLNGAILGMRKAEIKRKFDEIVDFAGVERYIDTPVKRYSSGMYVRLAFAVAAHLESEILIVDEVLAVGDAEFQKKCLGKMGDISKGEGRTVLFVSHNMAAVKSLCNKGILLKNGIKTFDGLSIDTINEYQKIEATENTNYVKWGFNDAPGDHRAKIISISVQPTVGDQIDFNSGISIIFIIQSKIKSSSLDVTFNLKNHDEVLVLQHGVLLADSSNLTEGYYTVKANIPAYVLNEGIYKLDVWLGLGGAEMLGKRVENALSFSVEKSQLDGILKSLPGVIRPLINYEIEYHFHE
jgi:lipopolysaccharide transport system ATP-binding protein